MHLFKKKKKKFSVCCFKSKWLGIFFPPFCFKKESSKIHLNPLCLHFLISNVKHQVCTLNLSRTTKYFSAFGHEMSEHYEHLCKTELHENYSGFCHMYSGVCEMIWVQKYATQLFMRQYMVMTGI